ncbi:hypothetical protein BASA60_004103 [Batrachochytrium salamandrivorans]|nr:hypothetical protein BASA60_004103 [Batrachochytrium salamandrivorans]
MIALVQILIAAVLIPVSFGAPAVDASEPAPTIRPLAFVPARKIYLVSRDGKCGEGTDSMCEAGVCCSKNGVCGTTKDHCKAGCQSEFGSCDPTGPWKTTTTVEENMVPNVHQAFVARNMAFVNKREKAVALIARRHLVSVIPARMSNLEKCQAMASVERGRSLGVSQETVALSMALVELRVITVVLAVNLDLVYVIPPCLFHNRLAENS